MRSGQNKSTSLQRIEIIIPVYNEQKHLLYVIRNLLSEIEKHPAVQRIIFVNDGSQDATKQIIEEFLPSRKIILLNHSSNKGKGAAMKTGLDQARKNHADAVIFMDGDGQHDPEYLADFIRQLTRYPMVFGYRHLEKDAPWIRKTGNRLAGFLINKIFNIKKRDLLCGFMAVRRELFEVLRWESDDYGVEAEISAMIGKKHIRFKEVFIRTIYLDRNKGVTLFHAFLILMRVPFWYFKH